MKKFTYVIVLASLLLLSACTQTIAPTPTQTIIPTPTVSDLFKTQALRFIEEANKLKSMTMEGVNFADYSAQLAEVNGVYELLDTLWLENFQVVTKENFELALESWDYAQLLWSLKIGKKDNPVEPNINHFKELMEYGGDFLRTDIHPSNYIVKEYRGKTFLPFDENISILFTVASEQFERAQPDLLEVIQQ